VVSEERRPSGGVPGTERISAFSDGVFAIAITLLVLSIGVPTDTHGLPEELLDAWPKYLSYALSFIVIGIIWAQHHAIFALIKRTDHVFLLINVLFLMWVAFLPFPTQILGQNLGKHNEQAAMSFYAAVFVLGTLPFNLLWRYAAHGRRLLADDAAPHLVRVTSRSYAIGPLLYLIDFALSFVSSRISLAFFILLAVFYAVAPIPAIGGSRVLRPFTGLGDTTAAPVPAEKTEDRRAHR